MLTMILAIDKNNLIGDSASKNGLPWHYPEDLQFYKNNTIHKINLMGRVTYESIGYALPNRDTYVLTSNKNLNFTDSTMLYSKDEAINLINNSKEEKKEVMLIGGVGIFESLFEYVDKIILTRINKEHKGDVYYNNLDLSKFSLTSEVIGKDTDLLFQTWERK